MADTTKKLEAVNDIISALGGTPLAALTVGTPNAHEKIALDLLSKHTKLLILHKDWRFSYEPKVAFTANGSGLIKMHTAGDPSTMNIMRVVMNESNPPPPAGMKDCEIRRATAAESADYQLYDIINKTFDWGAGTIVYLDVTRKLDFLQLPEEAQYYVTAISKSEAMTNCGAEPARISSARQEATKAWRMLMDNHLYRGGLASQSRNRQRVHVYQNQMLQGYITGRFPHLN